MDVKQTSALESIVKNALAQVDGELRTISVDVSDQNLTTY